MTFPLDLGRDEREVYGLMLMVLVFECKQIWGYATETAVGSYLVMESLGKEHGISGARVSQGISVGGINGQLTNALMFSNLAIDLTISSLFLYK